jgi:chromosome segregation ATPase
MMRISKKCLRLLQLGLLFFAMVSFAQKTPGQAGTSSSISGFWGIDGGESGFQITQSGTSLTMDLGNGITMTGDIQKGQYVSFRYKLTADDVRRRSRKSGDASGIQEDIAALEGKVVTYTATLNEQRDSMEGLYTDWQAEKNGDQPVVATPISQHLLLRRPNAQVEINEATLDFDQRNKRHSARLRDRAISLGNRKQGLEGDILALDSKEQQLETTRRELQTRIEAWESSIQDLNRALGKLRSEAEQVPGVRETLADEADLLKKIAQLEDQIRQRRLAGANTDDLNRKLASFRRGLEGEDDHIAKLLERTAIAELYRGWIKRLRDSQTGLFALRDQEVSLSARQADLEAQLTDLRSQLGAVDAELMQIGEGLAFNGLQILAIDVSANGDPVFQAAARETYNDLSELNAKIEKQKQAIASLKESTLEMRNAFFDAVRDSIATGKRLYTTQYSLAYARFGTDLFFDSVDIVKATGSGGVVGAVGELGKKLTEKLVIEKAFPPPTGVLPGSPEDKINKLYNAGLKNTWSKETIGYTAANRVFKDTISKGAKDTANKYLGQLVFDKVEYPIRFRLEVEPSLRPGTAEDYEVAEKALARLKKQLDSLNKGYWKGIKTKDVAVAAGRKLKGVSAQIAESLVKETAKLAVKVVMDEIEAAAWEDYYEALVVESEYYPLYYAAAMTVEDANQTLDDLLSQKAQILLGLKPQPGFRTVYSRKFRISDSLTISLRLQGKQDSEDPFNVSVGDYAAFPSVPPNGYTLRNLIGAARNERNGFTLAVR